MTSKFKNWLVRFLTSEDVNYLHSLIKEVRGIASGFRSMNHDLEDKIEEQQKKHDRFKYHIEHHCGDPLFCIGQNCGLILEDKSSCKVTCKSIRRELLDSFYTKERRRERGKYNTEEGEKDE